MQAVKYLLIMSLLGALCCSLTACSERNAEGRRAVSFMPSSWLHTEATSLYDKERQQTPVSTNERLNRITQRVANRLIAQAKLHYGQYCRGFQWEVTLFDKPQTKNAYCLPGGKIAIFTGILPVCRSEAGLAAVMGHEIAHALLDHGNERVTQQLGTSAVLAVAEAVMKNKEVSSSKRKTVMAALGLGSQLGIALPYSRDHEHEADRLGLKLMAAAGYDPAEAPTLWQRMQQQSTSSAPEFLSTHPSNQRRIGRLTSLLTEVRPLYEQAAQRYGLGEQL